jgi:hypothetical protein
MRSAAWARWRHVTESRQAGLLRNVEHRRVGQVECWSRFILSQPTSSSLSSVPARLRMNNVELGRHGRSRSNVWNYRGVNTFGAGRMEDHIRLSSPSSLLPMRCATVRGVATFAGILFRAQKRPLPGQRRYNRGFRRAGPYIRHRWHAGSRHDHSCHRPCRRPP